MNPCRDDKYVYVRFYIPLSWVAKLLLVCGGRYHLMYTFPDNDADFKQFFELVSKARRAGYVQHPITHWFKCPACRARWWRGEPMNHEAALEQQIHHRRMKELKPEVKP